MTRKATEKKQPKRYILSRSSSEQRSTSPSESLGEPPGAMMPHCSQLTLNSKNYEFLDIPAISKVCRFGWEEFPPSNDTIAPTLKRRISRFSQGHVAEGFFNIAQNAIRELLSQPCGSFQSRTYTSVKPSPVIEKSPGLTDNLASGCSTAMLSVALPDSISSSSSIALPARLFDPKQVLLLPAKFWSRPQSAIGSARIRSEC